MSTVEKIEKLRALMYEEYVKHRNLSNSKLLIISQTLDEEIAKYQQELAELRKTNERGGSEDGWKIRTTGTK
jgi:hypothetical protein